MLHTLILDALSAIAYGEAFLFLAVRLPTAGRLVHVEAVPGH